MDLQYLRGLVASENSSVQDVVQGALKEVYTVLPVIVSKASDGHTAQATPAIKKFITDVTGAVTSVQMDDLQTAPVHYPGGGGVTHTHPVQPNDEGTMIFASAAQDLWHQKGGVQDPIDNRRHHLADGRYLPGGRSDPRKLDPAPSTSSQQNRSDDGNHVFDTHPNNGLTSASTKKHLTQVGGSGSGGAGTLHLPGKVLKNASQVLINSIQQDPLPPPGVTIANRKKVAGEPIGAMGNQSSGIAGMMSGLLSGGASSMFASPIASQAGGLTSAITSAASSLSGVSGAGGLISTLTGSGGLSTALSALTTGASAMSGATTPTTGSFGLTDVLSHAQALSNFFGSDAPPSSVSLSTVLAPLQSGSTLSGLTSELTALAATVVAGSTTPSDATATVNGWIAQVAALMTNSATAISTLNAAAPLLNMALAAASAGTSLDPNENAVASAVSTPTLSSLTAMVNSIFTLSGAETAAAQAFPDAGATQAGATGGM